jgi:hypothetical protein
VLARINAVVPSQEKMDRVGFEPTTHATIIIIIFIIIAAHYGAAPPSSLVSLTFEPV